MATWVTRGPLLPGRGHYRRRHFTSRPGHVNPSSRGATSCPGDSLPRPGPNLPHPPDGRAGNALPLIPAKPGLAAEVRWVGCTPPGCSGRSSRTSVRQGNPTHLRHGNVIPVVVILLVFLVGLVAFAIDTGYVALTRTQ